MTETQENHGDLHSFAQVRVEYKCIKIEVIRGDYDANDANQIIQPKTKNLRHFGVVIFPKSLPRSIQIHLTCRSNPNPFTGTFAKHRPW